MEGRQFGILDAAPVGPGAATTQRISSVLIIGCVADTRLGIHLGWGEYADIASLFSAKNAYFGLTHAENMSYILRMICG